MIEKISYEELINISNQLESSAKAIEEITNKENINELSDFISTVEGYSKYLTTTVELYQEADDAISSLTQKK